MQEFDLLVIGGGPGGYVAAVRAAQRGLSVGVVEKERAGGVCLNWGCIPTKAMLRSAEVYETVLRAAEFGVSAENVALDYDAVTRRKDSVVKGLTDGVAGLLAANGVTVVEGHARFTSATTVDIYPTGESPLGAGGPRYAAEPAGDEPIDRASGRDVLIATGSAPVELPIPGADLPGVITSDGAFGLTEVPGRLCVIGGSAVGAEWASLFNSLGSEVTLVEMAPGLVPNEDAEIGKALQRSLEKAGAEVVTGSTVSKIERSGRGKSAALKVSIGEEQRTVDTVLVGVGRRPNTAALDLDRAGVATDERGFVPVDDQLRTNVEHVHAIGDVTGRILLAHVASHQGVVAAEVIAGDEHRRMDYTAVPAATFTHPEIASVGLTEARAKELGHEVVTAKFPFAALGRAQTFGDTDGFLKVVAGATYREVLGVHVIGPSASDLITEGTLAIALEARLDELAETVHAHPTLGEVGMEAATSALGLPIHTAPARRR